MKRLFGILAFLPLLAFARPPDSYIASGSRTPCGYQQLTNAALQSAVKLTIPASCPGIPGYAVIQCNSGAVRWRDDGTAPTASIGMSIASGAELDYAGIVPSLQFITSSSTPICDVSLYY